MSTLWQRYEKKAKTECRFVFAGFDFGKMFSEKKKMNSEAIYAFFMNPLFY